MNWMGCVATSVMGPRLVSLFDESLGPITRMPKVCKEAIVNMDGIVELSKRNRSLLLITVLPLVNNLDSDAKRSEMQHNLLL